MKKVLIILVLCTIVFTLPAQVVLASTFQEDPSSAQEVYSSVSLLSYYSHSLDLVIQKDATGTGTYLGKMVLANVPDNLTNTTANFASSGIQLSQSVSNLFALYDEEGILVGQCLLNEAEQVYNQIMAGLPQARQELAQVRAAVEDTGTYLNIGSLSTESELSNLYQEVMDKLSQISEMLDLLSRSLVGSSELKPTSLSLEVEPTTAFVGDNVAFCGRLSSEEVPLEGRRIEVLLNSATYLIVETNATGYYEDQLSVPYWYITEMEVQAVYYPQGEDVGLYLGALSPKIKLTVEYYQTNVALEVDTPAYLGKETTLRGNFSYGTSPPIDQRTAVLYLDNEAPSEFTTGLTFSKKIPLNTEISLGEHTITLSVVASGGYAPVVESIVFEVKQAVIALDMQLPRIGIIPGSVGLSGKAYSDLGPLENASIMVNIGGSNVPAFTNADGSFNARVKMGIALSLLGLLGREPLSITVTPQEPWNASLVMNKNIFMVSVPSLSLMVILLGVLAFYLPRRFKKRAMRARTPRARQVVLPAVPPVYPSQSTISLPREGEKQGHGEPTNPLLIWYQVALRVVQRATGAIIKPDETLREYAKRSNQALGPVGRYFMELTHMVEKLLYAVYQPKAEDIAKGKELAEAIREGNKVENH